VHFISLRSKYSLKNNMFIRRKIIF
jgi:hypothetical protein